MVYLLFPTTTFLFTTDYSSSEVFGCVGGVKCCVLCRVLARVSEIRRTVTSPCWRGLGDESQRDKFTFCLLF